MTPYTERRASHVSNKSTREIRYHALNLDLNTGLKAKPHTSQRRQPHGDLQVPSSPQKCHRGNLPANEAPIVTLKTRRNEPGKMISYQYLPKAA
jgi:hypothetical protein